MVQKDLTDNGLDLNVSKGEWRMKIAELRGGSNKKGTEAVMEGTQ